MKLFEKLLQVLFAHDVKHIFGVPGDAINPLIDALRHDKDMEYIHVSHEESGAFAASAAAKLTGDLQVCAGTVGPGAIHLLNGLYDAKKDHAPVLAIVGQVPSEYVGSAYHQEVDLPNLFHDVADYLAVIDNPDQFQSSVTEACNLAVAEGKVAVIVVPHDIGNKDVTDLPVTAICREKVGKIKAPDESIAKARKKIEDAKHIAILAGEGARQSKDKLLDLAKHLSAPIITSLKAKDLVPYDNEYVAGGLGLLGTRGGVKAMAECDLLLILGSDFPYKQWYSNKCEVVQVDNNAIALGRRAPGAVGLHSEVAPVVDMVLKEVSKKDNDHALKQVQHEKKVWDKLMDRQESITRSKDTIHPQAVAKTLSDLADDDCIFTCDTGEVTVWGARHLHLKKDQRFTASFNLASMAYALPASLGAQITYPDKQVISLSGDGGFNMLMGDFLTAVKYKLPIKVIVFNNGKLGLIKMEQEAEGYPESETDLCNPDYALLANAMGGTGFSADNPKTLKDTLSKALSIKGPVIVDAKVNPNEITWPPKIDAKQAIGFSMAKVHELLGI